MSVIAVRELRDVLAERFPDSLPLVYRTAPTVATGIGELDGMLPGGGLPRGRLVVWRPGGGVTAVLRAACDSVIARGERAAWIDAAGQVMGDGWSSGPLLVRPSGREEALECAEELVRCGGFGLVVLGPGEGSGQVGVRLSRAVRAGGGVLVAVQRDTSQAQFRIESCFAAKEWVWRRGPFGEPVEVEAATIEVSAWSLGWSGRVEFRLPVLSYGLRLALDPLLVDRRGAARRSAWPASRASTPPADTSSSLSIENRNRLSSSILHNRDNVNSRLVGRVS